MAAEYILKEGNPNVLLCERGIRTFETAYRYTLDLTAVPVLKELTHLPVIVDPSHAAGRRDLVTPLSLAAAAAGADGIIVEVHPQPEEAICDGPQALVARRLRGLRRAGRARGRGRGQGAVRRPQLIVAVLGVGLVGGSVGLAARERLGAEVRGFDPAPACSTARSSTARSTRRAASPPRRSTAPTAAFVAAPVRRAAEAWCARRWRPPRRRLRGDRRRLDQARRSWPRSTTRASSAATRWRAPRPRASSTRAPDLFDGATWYLTPTSRTEGVLYDRLYRLLADLGARPAAIDAETHDRLMAASRTCRTCSPTCSSPRPRGRSSPSGCRRPARASATPRAWPAPRARSGATSTSPTPTRWWRRSTTPSRGSRRCAARWPAATSAGSTSWNDAARDDRRRLLEADLAGGEVVELRVSVPNRPGVVAEVALALGRAPVNIVDMALYPAAGQHDRLDRAVDRRRAPTRRRRRG